MNPLESNIRFIFHNVLAASDYDSIQFMWLGQKQSRIGLPRNTSWLAIGQYDAARLLLCLT